MFGITESEMKYFNLVNSMLDIVVELSLDFTTIYIKRITRNFVSIVEPVGNKLFPERSK